MTTGEFTPQPAIIRDKYWQRQFVARHGLFPQPQFVEVTGDRAGSVELVEVLLSRPGSYILKPQFGSNGVGVLRVVSDGYCLTLTSDCPDMAVFLDEFPSDPRLRGRDVATYPL